MLKVINTKEPNVTKRKSITDFSVEPNSNKERSSKGVTWRLQRRSTSTYVIEQEALKLINTKTWTRTHPLIVHIPNPNSGYRLICPRSVTTEYITISYLPINDALTQHAACQWVQIDHPSRWDDASARSCHMCCPRYLQGLLSQFLQLEYQRACLLAQLVPYAAGSRAACTFNRALCVTPLAYLRYTRYLLVTCFIRLPLMCTTGPLFHLTGLLLDLAVISILSSYSPDASYLPYLPV